MSSAIIDPMDGKKPTKLWQVGAFTALASVFVSIEFFLFHYGLLTHAMLLALAIVYAAIILSLNWLIEEKFAKVLAIATWMLIATPIIMIFGASFFED